MFNRLTRLAIDLLAISTILAGVKRSTGFAPNLLGIQDPTIRTFFQRYFAIGDTIFGMISGYVVNSKYFLKTIP